MTRNRVKDLMMINLNRATDLYLATLETEGKSPRYIDWLKTRLRFFNDYMSYAKNCITILSARNSVTVVMHF